MCRKVERQPVAVLAMLEETAQEAERLGQESHHSVEVSGEPGLILLGDESLLRSAFSNLIFNAIRHTPQRTQVTVSWYEQGEHAELVVHDNGAGIPARHLPLSTKMLESGAGCVGRYESRRIG